MSRTITDTLHRGAPPELKIANRLGSDVWPSLHRHFIQLSSSFHLREGRWDHFRRGAQAMAANMTVGNGRRWRRLRWVVWGGAALLLLAPLAAMQVDTGVDWTLPDFVAMAVLLGLAGGAFELAVRVARSHLYVVAMGVAVATAFLMAWVNLAVGIIGDENNPANGIFFGVLAIGLIAAAFSRLRPRGMARAIEITAIAQGAASVATLVMGEGHGFALTGLFLAMWLLSAQLFRKVARLEADADGVT
jgi:hypothetical protein